MQYCTVLYYAAGHNDGAFDLYSKDVIFILQAEGVSERECPLQLYFNLFNLLMP